MTKKERSLRFNELPEKDRRILIRERERLDAKEAERWEVRK